MSKHNNQCIFCGGTGMTKEHLFPDWLKKLFPRKASTTHTFGIVQYAGGVAQTPAIQRKQGHTGTTKFRRVCLTCNGGWMKRLEDDAKPHLEDLIQGNQLDMAGVAQRTIARWAAKTVCVSECQRGEFTIPQSERDFIRKNDEAPRNWRVLIIPYSGSFFRDLYFWHHNGTVNTKIIAKYPLIGRAQMPVQSNPMTTCFIGMGEVVMLVIATDWRDLDARLAKHKPFLAKRIWPGLMPRLAWTTQATATDIVVKSLETLPERLVQN